jgi:hypothetical protein
MSLQPALTSYCDLTLRASLLSACCLQGLDVPGLLAVVYDLCTSSLPGAQDGRLHMFRLSHGLIVRWPCLRPTSAPPAPYASCPTRPRRAQHPRSTRPHYTWRLGRRKRPPKVIHQQPRRVSTMVVVLLGPNRPRSSPLSPRPPVLFALPACPLHRSSRARLPVFWTSRARRFTRSAHRPSRPRHLAGAACLPASPRPPGLLVHPAPFTFLIHFARVVSVSSLASHFQQPPRSPPAN